MKRIKEKNTSPIKYVFISILILTLAILIAAIINIMLSIVNKNDVTTEHIISMLEGIIGAIAAGFVLYQLKLSEKTESHQNDIEEATFLLQFNQTFIQDANMVEVERLLEDQAYYDDNGEKIINKENRQKFINYLVYLESLAPLILNNVLNLEHIDNLMAYRFFLAVNNVELQEKELIPFAEYYRGCYRLYNVWSEYRKNEGLHNPCDDCNDKSIMRELSEVKDYEMYLK